MPSHRSAAPNRYSNTWLVTRIVSRSATSAWFQWVDDQVTFRYKDYAADQRQALLTLSAEEFLRRSVQHVLPKSFVKIRHYGLLANRQRQQRLDQCRRLLLVTSALAGVCPAAHVAGDVDPPTNVPSCPHCGSGHLVHRPLPAQPAGAASGDAALPGDTS